MSKLPVISGRDAVKAFGKLGYLLDRQVGSHMILRNDSAPHRRLTIPDHRTVAKGTLRALIREAGLTMEEFWRFYERDRDTSWFLSVRNRQAVWHLACPSAVQAHRDPTLRVATLRARGQALDSTRALPAS